MRDEVVIIKFAKPDIQMADHYDRIIEAIESAEKNLMRWDIRVTSVSDSHNNRITLYLKMKDTVSFDNPGRRLRGISYYLLNHYPEIYKNIKVGTRLLYFF